MNSITARGHIRGNTVVVDEDLGLPEGALVTIRLETNEAPPSLAERLHDIIGIANELPEDMAMNHDHYLHGAMKK